jgi:hypothetical protein
VEPRKIHTGPLRKGSQNKIEFKVSNEGNQSLEITKIYSATGKSLVVREGEINKHILPNQSTKLEIILQINTVGPFVEVLLIDSNARNALNGQYAVMITGETGP